MVLMALWSEKYGIYNHHAYGLYFTMLLIYYLNL